MDSPQVIADTDPQSIMGCMTGEGPHIITVSHIYTQITREGPQPRDEKCEDIQHNTRVLHHHP